MTLTFTEEDLKRPISSDILASLEAAKERTLNPEPHLRQKPGPKPTLPPNTTVGVRLPNNIIERIDKLVGKLGKTRSDVVRVLVEAGLNAMEP